MKQPSQRVFNDPVSIMSFSKKKHEKSKDEQNLQALQELPRIKPIYNQDVIAGIMEDMIRATLEPPVKEDEEKYIPVFGPELCQTFVVRMKEKLKELEYSRYRLVCVVSIIQKKNQQVDYKMRLCWDPRMDNFIKYYYESAHFYIIGIVFLVYKD